MSNKKVVNLHLPTEIIEVARQVAFKQGYIYKGQGNLSGWVADLIEGEVEHLIKKPPTPTPQPLPTIKGILRKVKVRPPIVLDNDYE